MKKVDLIIAAAVIAVAAVLYFSGILRPGEKGARAVVTVDGKTYGEYDLSEDTSVTVEIPGGGYNSFVIKDGKADMTEADCRDHICVDHKPINLDGETIVCLPHKLVIEIVDGEQGIIDGATN